VINTIATDLISAHWSLC